MVSYPTGVLTLVFTDIQGSSELWQEHGASFQPVLDEHNRLMRAAAGRWRGYEVKTVGDAFFLVFRSAADALQFAVDAQLAFQEYSWSALHPGVSAVRVRMGLHTGEPLVGHHPGGLIDYFGPVVNRAARVGGAGHGNQIVVSEPTRAQALPELLPVSNAHPQVQAVREMLRPEALPQFLSGISFLDFGIHRLKGVGEEHLWQVLHPRLPREFPPLSTLDARLHNLPTPPSAYVGREEDLKEWLDLLLAPSTRLMTLIGFGGMGKTRSALQLAEMCIDDFKEGVWFVELEEARELDGALGRIASALHVPLQKQPSIREQLHAYLSDKKLLLVLDNTEQMGDAAGKLVADLLAAAPQIKVLVTTRRALELRSERCVEVRPLPPAEAESLFVENARSRSDDFMVTELNQPDIVELVRLLEGVPLAIELAASRIVGMTPREMLDRLSQQFRLLQTRNPELPARQRTLRGAIDWSYDLLTEDDKALFAQLAVFSGGFRMEDAEEICDTFDVFESVMELRRQSLLRQETHPETQETRFLMLLSVRSYAEEKLKELPDEGEAFHERHARHYLKFAEKRISQLATKEEATAVAQLAAEMDNLRAALEWAQQADEAELCGRLALALFRILHRQGLWTEARRWLDVGQEATLSLGKAGYVLRASLGLAEAAIAEDMGDFGLAREEAEASLARYRELHEVPGIADALNQLALIDYRQAEYDWAWGRLEEALELLPDRDFIRKGRIHHNFAMIASQRGENDQARALYEQALEHRRAAKDARGEAESLSNLGALEHCAGNLKAARPLYRAALSLFRRLKDRHWIGVVLQNLGELAEAEGDLDSAIGLFLHAERIFNDLRAGFVEYTRDYMAQLRARIGSDQYSEIQERMAGVPWEVLVEAE